MKNKLINRGYHLVSDSYLLSFELSNNSIDSVRNKVNTKIEEIDVRRVDYIVMECDEIISLISSAFGGETELTRSIIQQQKEIEERGRMVYAQYVAYIDEKAVGFGTRMDINDHEVSKLGGAATSKEFRGKGDLYCIDSEKN